MGSLIFSRLLLLFIAVPIIELILLIKVGQQIGALATIVIVILTGIMGASLARREGIQIFSKIRSTLNQGEIPGKEMVEGVLILIGGVLLLTPGFLTDLAGFSLLIPQIRVLYAKKLINHFKTKFQQRSSSYDNNNLEN